VPRSSSSRPRNWWRRSQKRPPKETSAIEESPIQETGPSLTGAVNVPKQPVKEPKPSTPSVQHPEASPVSTPAAPATAAATVEKTPKLAMLPDWLRHLPETIAANLPASDSEADDEPDVSKKGTPSPVSASALPVTKATKARPAPQVNKNDIWHEPEALIAELKTLSGNGATSKWAAAVLQQIRLLGPAIASRSDKAAAILDRLDELKQQALTTKLPDRGHARKWQEVGFSLGRRIDIWRLVALASKAETIEAVSPVLDSKKLAECLAAIEAATDKSPEGQAWREFLMIDSLKERCAKQPSSNEQLSRETAQRALTRLTRTPLTPAQRRFVCSAPVAALRVELWHWAAEPISLGELLRAIERYEATCLPHDAARLAVDYQSLLASPVEARRQLADQVDLHYRNANVRFTVTEELLNDLIPEQKMEYSQYHDTVLRRPVQGERLMETTLAVRMQPDPRRARLVLEVTGELAALTTTDAGLAQFHNESESRYVARKPLEIDMTKISVWPVEVYVVQNDTRLNSVETSVDGVPLVNWLVKMAAKSQHDMNMPAASEEVKQKIVTQASERIDAEVRERLHEVVDRLNKRVFDPLNTLALDPQMIAAKTDADRFTMRLRLGGEDQLGSHTPRPQAPAGSLASLQIHESVINNGIERLQLDGRTFSVPELSQHVAACLHCPAPFPTNPDNEDAMVTFAERNPIVVRCRDGKLELTLSIAKLKKSPHVWRNFQVRAYYKPEVRGRSAQLVREGVIEFPGPRNVSLALRGVFAHALSSKIPWKLIPEKLLNQPKLQNAAITQFDIVGGWIALSLGPRPQTATRRPWTGTR
jgi:hypothetical protein